MCTLATRYYVEPSIQGIEAAKQKFKIKEELTDDRIAQMKKENPELEKLRLRMEQEKLGLLKKAWFSINVPNFNMYIYVYVFNSKKFKNIL